MNFSSKQISMFSKPMQSNNSQHFLAPAALFFRSIHHRPTKQLTQKNPWTQYWHSLEGGSALDDHIISITADRTDQIYLIIGPKANKSFREEKNIQSCNRLNWLARVAEVSNSMGRSFSSAFVTLPSFPSHFPGLTNCWLNAANCCKLGH